MVYYYLSIRNDPRTHILSRWGDGFYGWCPDFFTAVVYAYTMWMYEGEDYDINSIKVNTLTDLREHLIDRGVSFQDNHSFDDTRILLFEEAGHHYQAMTKENFDCIDVDGEIVRSYVISNGIERLLDFCAILHRFMPILTDEVQLIKYVIRRVWVGYLPDSDTDREEILARYNIPWLVELVFGDEGVISFSDYHMFDEEFWQHCNLVNL